MNEVEHVYQCKLVDSLQFTLLVLDIAIELKQIT